MSNSVIKVENVSKAYRLGQIGGGTLKEDFARYWAKLLGKPDPNLKIGEEHHARKMGEQFWALDNVSFEVRQGEVLGIIGRNGAGKSTLLKILSQVTTPTSGQIKIKGRIASLLEVGTGFNPEMTGRENVFLNGAILGMTKAEIRGKFDEIVAFSEIEEFIDTPVKRYSSGMYVRLAFAVAAHLEPEILIVDEVLAVGDAEFQKKCLGKMKDVSKGGRTVLFVSHNMNAVQRLCSKAMVLKQGKLEYWGNVNEGLSKYSANAAMKGIFTYDSEKPVKPFARICQLEIITDGRQATVPLSPGAAIVLNFSLKSEKLLAHPKLTVGITNNRGERIIAVGTSFGPHPLPSLKDRATVGISFILPPIQPGIYQLDVGFYDQHEGVLQEIYAAGSIEVAEVNYLDMTNPSTPDLGHILVRSSWTTN
ncbi:MAG TPA: ABC transporter ATP-binding protein [Candidatus Saccharimonadales bacterium]|nr:ABC transporter ATP-binding protein [Candidatus Saccharimonadales bacterium]